MKKTFSRNQIIEAFGISETQLKRYISQRRIASPRPPLWTPERKRQRGAREYRWTLTEMRVSAKAIGKTKEFNQWNKQRIAEEKLGDI